LRLWTRPTLSSARDRTALDTAQLPLLCDTCARARSCRPGPIVRLRALDSPRSVRPAGAAFGDWGGNAKRVRARAYRPGLAVKPRLWCRRCVSPARLSHWGQRPQTRARDAVSFQVRLIVGNIILMSGISFCRARARRLLIESCWRYTSDKIARRQCVIIVAYCAHSLQKYPDIMFRPHWQTVPQYLISPL